MIFRYDHFLVRAAADSDCMQLLAWRNSPGVRNWMTDTDEISIESHKNWFAARGQNGTSVYILEWQGVPVGVFTFRINPEDSADRLLTMYIIDKYQNSGLGLVLEWFLLETVFQDPACETVSGLAFPDNPVLKLHKFFAFDIKDDGSKYVSISMTIRHYREISPGLRGQIFSAG